MVLPAPPSGYRPNVGLAVFNAAGKVWIGRRRGARLPYAWQAPQGGIDRGEDVEEAALRELEEETGIHPGLVEILEYTTDWLTYDFTPDMLRGRMNRHRGQAQIWYAFRFLGADSDVRIDLHKPVEFDDWRWEELAALPDLIVPFKRPVYETVVRRFARHARPVAE
jgi:putative (di)nucleoside polyphosphate hydrolase